ACVAVALFLWLYRRERPELSRRRRALLVSLRMLVILAVVAMLVEPVLITSRRETLRSHLAIVVDDSESMRFADPYTDESRAVAAASALGLRSKGGRSPVDRLRETPRLELAREALRLQLEKLARGRELFVYDLGTAARPGSIGKARDRTLDNLAPSRGVSPL